MLSSDNFLKILLGKFRLVKTASRCWFFGCRLTLISVFDGRGRHIIHRTLSLNNNHILLLAIVCYEVSSLWAWLQDVMRMVLVIELLFNYR